MKENPMRKIKIEKMTLHCSTADAGKLEKSKKLLELISGMKAVQTKAKRRIPDFKIRPGLPIGCKVTIRNQEKIKKLLNLFFESIEKRLRKKKITSGNFSFGIKEYIDIPSIKYQRDIGILGFDVNVTLARAGKRVQKKKCKKGRLPKRQGITKEETVDFIKENFGVEVT